MDSSELTFDERDEFSRKPIAEKVIALLESDIDISPMVIDGGWGTGKSEFCFKLINLLKVKDTHHLIYIDAFKADHADEPLMTVLAEVINVLPDEESKQSFIIKALPAVRYGVKTLAKAGVSHILRQDAAAVLDDFDDVIQSTADKAIDATVKSLLKDHVKAEASLKALKDALAEIVLEKPIIIFIDELDRCRPNFAVDMIEIIKHTFDSSAVSFVLITNTQQLRASINNCYGTSVDAKRYLDKFVKFIFALPHKYSSDGWHFKYASFEHYENLVRESSILRESSLSDQEVSFFMSDLIKVRSLSLREVETLIRYLEIYQLLTNRRGLENGTTFGYTLLRLVGVVLFCFNAKLTKEISDGRANAEEFATYFGEVSIVPIRESSLEVTHLQAIVTMLGQECLYKNELFEPEEGHHADEWHELIRRYFRGGGRPREYGVTKEVTTAIHVLSLSVR